MKDEALKLALDALETELSIDWGNQDEFNASAEKMYEAIAAINEALAQQEKDYERGFVDGMQKQMQSSVDKAVNRMAQPEQELTNIERHETNIQKFLGAPQQPEQEPVAVYGYCPECGAKGVMRERRPNGNDKCANGHTYPSSKSTPPQPEQLHASEDVSIGVDVTEDGVHVTALRSYRNGAKVVFYSQFHSAPQSEQEPVADDFFKMIADKNPKPFPLPQRTWVGLFDEEIWQIATGCTIGGDLHADKFARAIEAKLKEKNNG